MRIPLHCSAYDYGVGNLKYKWEMYQSSSSSWIKPSHRAMNIMSSELIFSVITEDDEGVYHCIATNYDGSVVSNNATVTVYGEFTSVTIMG